MHGDTPTRDLSDSPDDAPEPSVIAPGELAEPAPRSRSLAPS